MKELPFPTLALLPTLLLVAAAGLFLSARAPRWTRSLGVVVVVVVVAVLAGSCLLTLAEVGGFRYVGVGGFVGARLCADLAPAGLGPFLPLVLEPLTAPLLLATALIGAAGNVGLALGWARRHSGVTPSAVGAGLLLEASVLVVVLADHPAHVVAAAALSGAVVALALGLAGGGGGLIQLFGVQRIGDAGLLVALAALTASLSSTADLSFTQLLAADALSPWERLSSGAFDGFAHRTLWFIAGIGLVTGVASRAGWLCWPWLRDATADPHTPAPLLGLVHGLGLQGCAAILLLRLHPIIALSPEVQDGLVVVGALTLLGAGVLALAGRDLLRLDAHLLAAFSGLMAICAGTQDVVGVAFAGLFLMSAGLGLPWAFAEVVERSGSRDPRALGGLEPLLPRTHSARLLLTAGIAALPPFAGFVVVDRAVQAAVFSTRIPAGVVVAVVLGVVLVGLAGWRALHLVFTGARPEATTADVVESGLASTLAPWVVALAASALTLLAVPQGLLELLPWELSLDPVLTSFVRPSLVQSTPVRELFIAAQAPPPLSQATFALLVLGLGLLPWLTSALWWRRGRGRVLAGEKGADETAVAALARWLARLAGQDSLVARSVQESVERLSRLLAVNLVPAVLSVVLHRLPAAFAAVTAFGLRLLQNGGAQQAFFLALLAAAGLLWLGRTPGTG